jgi:hypothetical protein
VATGKRANQRARAGEHPNRVGREREHREEQQRPTAKRGRARLSSFTWSATYTSRYTQHSYSLLTIPTATGAGLKSVCEYEGGATDGPAQILGWGDYLQLEPDPAA